MKDRNAKKIGNKYASKIREHIILGCRYLAVALLLIAMYLNWVNNRKNILESLASVGVIFLIGVAWLVKGWENEGRILWSNILLGVVAITVSAIYLLLLIYP